MGRFGLDPWRQSLREPPLKLLGNRQRSSTVSRKLNGGGQTVRLRVRDWTCQKKHHTPKALPVCLRQPFLWSRKIADQDIPEGDGAWRVVDEPRARGEGRGEDYPGDVEQSGGPAPFDAMS